MVALPVKPQFSLGPLILAMVSIALFFAGQSMTDLLAYDRYALQSMETWRLISGNLIHTNGYHLVLNLVGLVLLWALHGEHYRPVTFLKLFIWCGLGTSLGIYFFSPQLIWYVGLSGALHGIFVWGACMDILNKVRSGWLLLAGVAAKLLFEQFQGSSEDVASLIDASVAIDAHLYGAVCGAVLFLLMWLFTLTADFIAARRKA
ncbi:rhombosortase [uncultured Alteromonas sp.]|uniref:rhombosortase n=1 Tax=uncultured Alteromonas sp. TaxID=179113 RepID=UPI0025D95D83|nr:rhombosortase [uncultured Alteromonas sp.]